MSGYIAELLFWVPRLLARHMRSRHSAIFVQEFTRRVFFHLRQFQRAECAEEAELARHFRDRIAGDWNSEREPVSSNDALDWYRSIDRCNDELVDFVHSTSCDAVVLKNYGSDLLPWSMVCYHAPCLPLYQHFKGISSLLQQLEVRRRLGDAVICEWVREWKLERLTRWAQNTKRPRRVSK